MPADMTAAEAVNRVADLREYGPRACACIGGQWCCANTYGQALAIHRALHITVKLLADAAEHLGINHGDNHD